MNPNTPPPPDDDALAREERELAALYRRLPQAEPDAALDAAVLAQASRAVAPSRRHPLPRWMVALSSAAVLVLAAGVVWRLEFAQQQTAPAAAPPALQQAQPDVPDTTTLQEMAPPAEPTAAPASGRASQPVMARRAPVIAPAQSAPQMREEREQHAPAITPQAKALAAPAAKRAAAAPPRGTPQGAVDEASTLQLPPRLVPVPPAPPPVPLKPSTAMPPQPPTAVAATSAVDMAKQDKAAAPASTAAARDATTTVPPAFTQRVEQIRHALRQGGSRVEAHKAVQTLQRDFPGVTLPDDLRAFGDEEHP